MRTAECGPLNAELNADGRRLRGKMVGSLGFRTPLLTLPPGVDFAESTGATDG